MSAAILFVVAVAVLLPLLHRDLRRADAKRRRRVWLATNPELARMARSMNALKAQIGIALLPAAQKAAAAMARLGKTLNDAHKETNHV